MSYKVYKKHVNKYGKKPSGTGSGSSYTQSVYLFSGRSITPDKKPSLGSNKTREGKNLNRNLSLTAIGGSAVNKTHSRNIKGDSMTTLKSKRSISSSSSYNHHISSSKTTGSKSYRKTPDDGDKDGKYLDTVRGLKTENKKLINLVKDTERTLNDKIKENRKELVS